LFSKIDNRLAEEFKTFLLSAPCGGNRTGTIARNIAATYFSVFKAALKQAFVDGYLTVNLSAKIKGIQDQESCREFLTAEELNTLVATSCDQPMLKNAALFSALTGLRHCDIQKMRWKEIQIDGDQVRLNFTQQKQKALNICPFRRRRWHFAASRKSSINLFLKICPTPFGFLNRSNVRLNPLA
jgi:integrase